MSAPVVIVMLSETGIEIATAYTTSERETSIKKDGRNHLPLASFASPCLIRLLSVSIPDILGYCQKHSRHLTQEGPINTCGRCKWISSDNRLPVLCRRVGRGPAPSRGWSQAPSRRVGARQSHLVRTFMSWSCGSSVRTYSASPICTR